MGTITNMAVPEAHEFDIVALAESTTAAFAVLFPWYQRKQSCQKLQRISGQTEHYVEALTYSVTAAQHGYTLADDVAVLVHSLEVEKERFTEKEKDDYMRGMLVLATAGKKVAEQADCRFQEVRAEFEKLITEAKAKSELRGAFSDTPVKAVQDDLAALESSLPVLEKFSNSISLYACWWNEMQMQACSIQQRQEVKAGGGPYSLRQRGVVTTWREVKKKYAVYTEKIKHLQTQHPTIFIDPNSRQVAAHHMERSVSEESDTSVVYMPVSIVTSIFSHGHRLHRSRRHRCGYEEDLPSTPGSSTDAHHHHHSHFHSVGYYKDKVKHLGHHITHSSCLPWNHRREPEGQYD